MKVVVCGLGYVGATTAACLLKEGHHVVGVDVDAAKNEAFAAGRSPVREPGVDELLAEGLAAGRLACGRSVAEHGADAHFVLACVGTPVAADGGLDLRQVAAVTEQIAAAAASRDAAVPLTIVYRSTMLPGTMASQVLPALASRAGPPGEGYEVVYNPEFLREGSAVADYFAPPKTVIGERLPGAGDALRPLCEHLGAPLFQVPLEAAEFAKYADNAFHALKVAFANEIGRFAASLRLAPQRLADMLLADAKLNVSPAYLRPGGAFGGSCLPKDLRALAARLRAGDVDAPVLTAILASNEVHKRFLLERVVAKAPPAGRVLLLGLTFKAATDDLRESPLADLANQLLERGFRLSVFDPDLDAARLLGVNRRLARTQLRRVLGCLVEDPEPALRQADLIVLGKSLPALAGRLADDARLLDLHRL